MELCELRGVADDKEVVNNCHEIIDKYLSYENSSLDFVYKCLDTSIQNCSWLFAWRFLNMEIDKLSGKYEEDKKNYEQEQRRILLDYTPIDLGNRFLSEEELKTLNEKFGVIDANGVFHTGIRKEKKIDHRQLASYLQEQEKILKYYIRVGTATGYNEGIICAEAIRYGDENLLKEFLLTKEMAIAVYNIIMSRKDPRFNSFEEKLDYYADDFGFSTIRYNIIHRIYNRELFERNTEVLSKTLGKRFDKRFFREVLKDREFNGV